MKYEVFFTSTEYSKQAIFESISDAIEFGRNRGESFSIHEEGGGRMLGYADAPNLTFINCYDQGN